MPSFVIDIWFDKRAANVQKLAQQTFSFVETTVIRTFYEIQRRSFMASMRFVGICPVFEKLMAKSYAMF